MGANCGFRSAEQGAHEVGMRRRRRLAARTEAYIRRPGFARGSHTSSLLMRED